MGLDYSKTEEELLSFNLPKDFFSEVSFLEVKKATFMNENKNKSNIKLAY